MKIFLNYLTAVLFLSLVVFASCGGDDNGGDPEDTKLADFVGILVSGTATVTTVTPGDGQTALEWEGMTVSFTGTVDGGTYTTVGSANETVFPASGNWTIAEGGSTGFIITRTEDGVAMDASATAEALQLSFDISTAATRTKVIDGGWVFAFDF
ncbi:MAG: hypothetical protein OCD76_19710 [Reichenbachiella sp.]